MKRLVIATMVGLMTVTSAVLPAFAEEQTGAASETADQSATQAAEAGSASETADQSAIQEAEAGSKRAPKQEVAEPEGAIGKDAAKEKALADAGLTTDQTGKVRSRVTTLEYGTVIYKVKFTFDGQKHTYQINATTGEIIDKVVE